VGGNPRAGKTHPHSTLKVLNSYCSYIKGQKVKRGGSTSEPSPYGFGSTQPPGFNSAPFCAALKELATHFPLPASLSKKGLEMTIPKDTNS
tara:strand:+ start:53204 stop:53476 length:273 start_codon:yes stop_codon:yes gene_type:complete